VAIFRRELRTLSPSPSLSLLVLIRSGLTAHSSGYTAAARIAYETQFYCWWRRLHRKHVMWYLSYQSVGALTVVYQRAINIRPIVLTRSTKGCLQVIAYKRSGHPRYNTFTNKTTYFWLNGSELSFVLLQVDNLCCTHCYMEITWIPCKSETNIMRQVF
jgi:hypothetical protein